MPIIPVRVLVEVDGPPREVGRRLAVLAAESPDVTLMTAGGSFTARLAGDDALLAAAADAAPRYLGDDDGPASRCGSVVYWLRTAAELAWRARHGR